jgi:hypothetical protein
MRTRVHTSPDKLSQNDSMKMVDASMMKMFQAFHKEIHPIIEKNVTNTKNQGNAFVQHWHQVQKGRPNITNTTTFWTISKLFQFSNIQDYKDFVLKLPDINNHVALLEVDSDRSKFQYQIRSKNPSEKVTHVITTDDTNDETYDDMTSITTNKSTNGQQHNDTDNWNTCYGTSNDLSEMLTTFWPTIEHYIAQNPMHYHALRWKHWIEHDYLHMGTDLTQLKNVLGISTMDQLYVILHDSPALNSTSELKWDHKICYWPHHTLEPTLTNNEFNKQTFPTKVSMDTVNIEAESDAANDVIKPHHIY